MNAAAISICTYIDVFWIASESLQDHFSVALAAQLESSMNFQECCTIVVY